MHVQPQLHGHEEIVERPFSTNEIAFEKDISQECSLLLIADRPKLSSPVKFLGALKKSASQLAIVQKKPTSPELGHKYPFATIQENDH